MPAIRNTTVLSDLATASVLQPFADATEGKMGAVGSGTVKVGGLLSYNGKLNLTAYLYYDYSARMPNEPQQQTDRTYPVSLKGETFYTTRTEQHRYYATQYIFFASVITIGAMSWIQWRRSLSRAA